ncbi:cysteine desulfurase [Roseomonas sp. M0104]|uniref:Cysteine desulfurase n=1 Tax=Teichococcus coralli TaxID=2545983 RepID=A0A845BD26_9PROT|nr:cysteine desulfurase family protein [Pseudoroseomonas coralli]MXP63964.1 cysteine desulfurase [Pseudoroseomonas coralli]
MTPLYLDANATEPLRPAARQAMLEALDLVGNPSSVHAAGRASRQVLERARGCVAERFGARPRDVVFTSGATEANALALHALGRGRRILAGATEHPAILRAAPGITLLPVQDDGRINLTALADALSEGPAALVCLMAANNETGVLHPLEEAVRLCREHGALLHVDAVQSAGRLPLDLAAMGADSMAVSAHKLGGPKGAGALLLRAGLDVEALLPGGGQERGRRGGTEPLPAIAGFAAAVMEFDLASGARLGALRDAIEAGAGARVVGAEAPRLPNTSCLLLPGAPAETQVIALDLAGVQVSAGAACSSGKVGASPVLQAMGLGPDAGCAIRVSLPWNAAEDVARRFLTAYDAVRQRLRR